MAAVQERLSVAEIRIEENTRMTNETRDAVVSLEQRMDRRFDAIDRRFDTVDVRFAAIDQRFEAMDAKLSRYFTWLVGLYVTSLVAVIAALIAR